MTEAVLGVGDLLALYDAHGGAHYGEDVTQLEHALQCASLATRAGASAELVGAALLHDVGHLLAAQRPPEAGPEGDDHHESRGARVLASLFGASVAAPVALHVLAKRWRCTMERSYLDTLSDASRASLAEQGGMLDVDARARFEASPSFAEAVALRGWDDAAKVRGLAAGTLDDHTALLESLAARHAAGGR